uniref:NADH-quinone oxidoreductase subunit N n=1 Tax=Thermogemmatispora argillosa TaxID=2045280 RepID=A0A455T2Y2_9CHLR|nr:NADH-quinone oxidoreductase subunit N [Thermogemmatispora argillosa]
MATGFKVADLYLLSPELSLTLLALVVMAVDLFVKRRAITATVALVGLLVPAFLTISLILTNTGTARRAFFNMLVVDNYALFFKVVFLLIAAVMILSSYSYVTKYVRGAGEFYTLLLFSTTGMMLMASTGELISLYISLELTSFPLYVMAGLLRTDQRSAEAAVKYVLLGAMSSAILLYGLALLYGLTGTTDLLSIAGTFARGLQDGNLLVIVADILILAGFGFKISAVPFHMWAPDIYEGAPTPATAFFSVGSKAAGFAGLLRIFFYGGLNLRDLPQLVVVVAIMAILTMTLGNVVAAVQANVKRMMAYSSIAQAGYLLVGFCASLATGRPEGNAAVLFFILVYVLTNLGAFAGIIALANATGGEQIEDFRGLARREPLVSLGTALCLLSLAGIPPVAGFWSKVFLFSAAWSQGVEMNQPWLQWLVIIALLNSVVSLVYYGRIVKAMYFDAPPREDRLSTPLGLSSSIVLATAALLVLIVVAQVVLNWALPAASMLFASAQGVLTALGH